MDAHGITVRNLTISRSALKSSPSTHMKRDSGVRTGHCYGLPESRPTGAEGNDGLVRVTVNISRSFLEYLTFIRKRY
jgi:hypothetical protein